MLETGQILNNTYRIESKIGSGGGGIVYKAYHIRLERYVAVKLIKENVKSAVNERGEADILKRLKHDGLPQVYDFVNDGDDVYTVMEYIDGHSLFDEIVTRKKIPCAQALQWAKELCLAAAYLHTRKPAIIHSDIKPQNIMITTEGKVCLIDFNISSVFGNGIYTVGSSDGYSPPEQYSARPDRTLSTKTPDYDMTELIDDDSTVLLTDFDATEIIDESKRYELPSSVIDSRSDVYSMGAVMYSMITGMKPNNSKRNVVPLKRIDPSLPDALIFIIEKAMSKEKKDRYASAEEMFGALENINRLDKRFRRLQTRQKAAYAFASSLLVCSAASVFIGWRTMQNEAAGQYSSLLSALSEMNMTKDYTDFDKVYSEVEEHGTCADLVFYLAAKLYDENDLESAQKVLEENVIPAANDLSDELLPTAYLMEADILFRNEQYSEAGTYYERSVSSGTDNAGTYRDYAICLARSGDTAAAKNILERAEKAGLTKDSIFMVKGEIEYMDKDHPSAVDDLIQAIELSEDDGIKRNAYIVCSKAYKAMEKAGDADRYASHIAMLEDSVSQLPQDLTMQLREDLVQAYISYGESSGSYEYFSKAVLQLDEMRRLGWRNYRTDMNIAVLLDRMGRTDTCMEVLTEMAQMSEYAPYYYTIYTRLAYTEADLQGKKKAEERNYSVFEEYYERTVQEYERYSANGNSDPEMGRLTQLRNDLAETGWLD